MPRQFNEESIVFSISNVDTWDIHMVPKMNLNPYPHHTKKKKSILKLIINLNARVKTTKISENRRKISDSLNKAKIS